MSERKYFAVSLKHLYPWKFGDRLCLWGYKRTQDNEERCFGGYTECLENAELYSIEEFCGAYNKTLPHLMKEEPVKIDYKQWRSLKEHYDSVLVAREDVESYYKMCGFMKEADKVIADLEENHKKEVEQLLILNREQNNAANRLRDSMEKVIRHSKYKRCLAMARWCEIGAQFQHNNVMQFDNPFYIKRAEWLEKWHKRWLELAEKFKPNKEAK